MGFTRGTQQVGSSQITDGSIVDADVNASAAIDASKIADGSVSSTEFQYISTLSSNAQTQINTKVTTSNWASTTITGTWITNTTYTAYRKIIGDTMILHGKVSLAGAPTAAALTINMPSDYTINTTALITADGRTPIASSAILDDSGGAGYVGGCAVVSTTQFNIYLITTGSTYAAYDSVTATTPVTWGSGDSVRFQVILPVTPV